MTKEEEESLIQVEEEPDNGTGSKKGTIAGAVALIIGTSIGSGILALPQKASPAVKCYLFNSFAVFVSMLQNSLGTSS